MRLSGKNGKRPKERSKKRSCRYCDAPKGNPNHKSLARESICQNCTKKGHFAKACKSKYRKRPEIKEIAEPEYTEESKVDKLTNIATKIKHVTDRKKHITMTIKTEGTEKEFIIDTGSPVTMLPPEKEVLKYKKIKPITIKNLEFNKDEVKFG